MSDFDALLDDIVRGAARQRKLIVENIGLKVPMRRPYWWEHVLCVLPAGRRHVERRISRDFLKAIIALGEKEQ